MAEGNRKLQDVVQDFDNAMLVTRDANGTLRARPMAVADMGGDGSLWFVTSIESGTANEILGDSHVAVTFQGPTRFASISGKAEVVRDRKRVEALWRPAWRAWFPNGKEDPSLVLLQVHATSGEYWDQTGTRGLKFAIDAIRAVVRGERPNPQRIQDHGSVDVT